MKQFSGFPARMRFTPVPDVIFSHLLPEIEDIAELKITLAVLHVLYNKKGYPRFTTYRELLTNPIVAGSLAQDGKAVEDVLRSSLEDAVERGTFLRVEAKRGDKSDYVYFLNTEADRQTVERIRNGELSISGVEIEQKAEHVVQEKLPDIFTLYEQNIGMLTPMISDELRDALKVYPEAWIRDAIKESANQNKRKWSYISAILERWAAEGKTDGTYRGDTKKADPDKYIKGKYGHMVQR